MNSNALSVILRINFSSKVQRLLRLFHPELQFKLFTKQTKNYFSNLTPIENTSNVYRVGGGIENTYGWRWFLLNLSSPNKVVNDDNAVNSLPTLTLDFMDCSRVHCLSRCVFASIHASTCEVRSDSSRFITKIGHRIFWV